MSGIPQYWRGENYPPFMGIEKRIREQKSKHDYYMKNRDHLQGKMKQYAESHAEELKAYKCNYRKANREKLVEKKREWRKSHPLEHTAHKRSQALKQGMDGVKCVLCGSSENIDFHHIDYNHPDLVIPLCHCEHMEMHARMRNETGHHPLSVRYYDHTDAYLKEVDFREAAKEL